ncbi:MAG: hypothetical protein IPL75_02520 [Acidobacteria bacterium]|nr:hypothetical protein [Acidobacteriota bacterium]
MTAKRLIARLDIKGPHVVRGVHLEGLRVVGTPDDLVSRYAAAGIDELLFIDTVASLYGRNNTRSVVERTAQAAFIPLTVGGGVRTLQDVDELLRAGADRVAVNSAAVRNPALVTDIARSFGSQCVVAAIDAKRRLGGGWDVLIDNAREATGRDVLEWTREVVDRTAGGRRNLGSRLFREYVRRVGRAGLQRPLAPGSIPSRHVRPVPAGHLLSTIVVRQSPRLQDQPVYLGHGIVGRHGHGRRDVSHSGRTPGGLSAALRVHYGRGGVATGSCAGCRGHPKPPARAAGVWAGTVPRPGLSGPTLRPAPLEGLAATAILLCDPWPLVAVT